ncbi:MAG: hypothetical protein DDT40_00014 [candidate division WS2 bacterium]|uniref:Uncharacterized protein n=1 Tax=Psychracetigena formicireducens TaxID=2986056 RepID=A0A9E2BFB3_PSYF1|nr:hypothetical protein [Candidatus Psychracetigena formicireducens]MBT9144548.1 hypothetical protein [Candidatus Psychracetigena formicireducens]MBT9149851.1 hypothetical protein [Candidatus Psychracetigena formicireducens]
MKCLISFISKDGIVILTEEGGKGSIPSKESGDLSNFSIGQMLEVQPTNREYNGKQVFIIDKKENKPNFEEMLQKYIKESNEEYLDFYKRKQKKKRK